MPDDIHKDESAYEMGAGAKERAEGLPGVASVETVRDGEVSGLELTLEGGTTFMVPVDAFTQMEEMNSHTLINQLRSEYGPGDED